MKSSNRKTRNSHGALYRGGRFLARHFPAASMTLVVLLIVLAYTNSILQFAGFA